MKPTARDVLVRAAALIRRDGWHQGSYSGPGGELCIFAAIDCAAVESGTGHICDAAILLAKSRIGIAPNARLSEWNDAEGMTLERVLSVLEMQS